MIVAIQEREDSVLQYPTEETETLRDVAVLKTAIERRVTVEPGVVSPTTRVIAIARQVKDVKIGIGKEAKSASLSRIRVGIVDAATDKEVSVGDLPKDVEAAGVRIDGVPKGDGASTDASPGIVGQALNPTSGKSLRRGEN